MPVLGCGAEMGKLMDVSDQDVATIEDVIAERLALGVSQVQAQRQAVDEALAQLADERSMVMAAVREQLGVKDEPEVSEESEPALFNTPDSDYTIPNGTDPDQSTAATADEIALLTSKVGAGVGVDKPYVGRPINSFLLDGRVLQGLARALGTKIAGFATNPVLTSAQRATVKKFNGVYIKGVTFIREGTDRPNLAVLGHEFGHHLKATRPDLYADLVDALRPYVDPKKYQAFLDAPVASNTERDSAAVREEFIGEVFSDGFMDKGFWKAVGDKNPDLLRDLVQALSDLIDTIKTKIGYSPKTEKYLSDFDAVMTLAGETLAEFAQPIPFSNKAQTETPQFKKWFGDSKVVDAPGSPKLVYHSTNAFKWGATDLGFTVFDTKVSELGSHFGTVEQANSFGNGDRRRVMPVYLSIKKPLRLEDFGAFDAYAVTPQLEDLGIISDEQGQAIRELNQVDAIASMQASIKQAGYDGVVYLNRREGASDGTNESADTLNEMSDAEIRRKYPEARDSYIAFDPEQIKSSIGNNGDFDGTNPDIRFANKAQSKWKDETDRWQFAPGQMAYDLLGKAAMPFLDRLYLTTANKETRQALRQMKIQVQKAMETTAEMAAEVNKMSAAERELVSDIIEKEVKAGVTPTANAVHTAAMMNEAFGKQSDELIRLGMLTPEAVDRWRGKYLPRYYESKMGGPLAGLWDDAIRVFREPKTLQGIKGKNLRGRGMTQTIDPNDLAEWQADGWEVRDSTYDPATSSTVQVWRDFTKEERVKMKEIRDAGFRFVMGYMATQKDIALGKMYESIAATPSMASNTETQDSVQVPATKAPETGAFRYGKLAGMWVPRSVMSQLSVQDELENDALKLYRKALSLWKEGKTVLNPVSHMNNFVSNMFNAHFAGISPMNVAAYAGTIKDLATTSTMVKEANDNGLWIGSLSQEELGKLLPPDLQTLINKQDSKTVTGMRLAYNVLTWGLRRPMQAAYEFGDKFFKYMIYKDARARGLEPQDAVDYALKYIFNYDDLPKGARIIRDVGIPFFSYTYKAVPMLANTALTHPLRMLAPAGALTIASMAAYAIAAGGDDEDWKESIKKYLMDEDFRKEADAMREAETKLLPEWMKGRTSLGTPKVLRMGTDELTQHPVFLDTSRFIPGGDLFDVHGNAGGIPWLQPFTPSNPLLSTYSAMFGNKDMFSGKELVSKDADTDMEAARKRAMWLWKMAAPAIAVNQSHWNRAVQAVANETGSDLPYLPDPLGGDLTGVGSDGLPVQGKYAAMNTIGIKARPQDLEFSETMQKITKKKTLAELDAQLRRARSQMQKDQMKETSYEKLREQIMEKKERVREGMTVDGEEK